jgi:hypothetical protein
MNIRALLVLTLVGFGAASCGENKPPSTTQANADLGTKAAQSSQQPAAKTAKVDPATIQPPAPPPDAQWTILCDRVEGPAHVTEAGIRKSQLIQVSGMTDWYVIHSETDSTIYYGYYRALDNSGEKQRAESDRARIASLADRLGNPLVRGGILVPVTPADPVAPAEWNLLNTPKDAYWSIEIATFSGNARRKEDAVEMVHALRDQGEKQAYFYHGSTASSVCIGAWKREAVAEQGTGIARNGETRDDAHTQSADQPLLVLSDVAPPNMPAHVVDRNTGKSMTVEAPKLEVLDPEMKAKIDNPIYKYHLVNGAAYGMKDNPDPSVLIAIPHDQSIARDDDWRLNGGVAPNSAQSTPRAAPTSAGDSILRSIGDH